ncbi:MAG: methyl-accepting chemotaxis protein [Brevinema sp.]
MSNQEKSFSTSLDPKRDAHLKVFISKVYAICLMLSVPFAMLQEIFINMNKIYANKTVLLRDILANFGHSESLLFYLFFAMIQWIGISIYINPIKKYLKYNVKYEQALQRFTHPNTMLWLSLISSIIVLSMTHLIAMEQSQQHESKILILDTIYRVLWQIVTGYLMVYGLLEANTTIGQYFDKDSQSQQNIRGSIPKISILYVLMSLLIIISMLKTIFNLDNLSKETQSLTTIDSVINYNNGNIFMIVICILTIIYFYNSLISNVKNNIYSFLDLAAQNGLKPVSFFYQENNIIRRVVSSLNIFFITIFKKFKKTFDAFTEMVNHRQKLTDKITEFIDVVQNQKVMFIDLAISKKTINHNMEQLVVCINNQQQIFDTINKQINSLTINSERLSHSFDSLNQEHIQCLLSTEESTTSLTSFISTSGSIKQQIEEIFTIIEDTAIETNNINKILDIIKHITEQTKLLSISASIEAAHGGSSSSDFSSVAEEIRILADMSHDAVNNIALRVSVIKHFIESSIVLSTESIEAIEKNMRESEQITQDLKVSIQNTQLLNHNINTFTDRIIKNIDVFQQEEQTSISITNFLISLSNDITKNKPLSSDLYEHLEVYKNYISDNFNTLQKIDSMQYQWQIKELQIKQIIDSTLSSNK